MKESICSASHKCFWLLGILTATLSSVTAHANTVNSVTESVTGHKPVAAPRLDNQSPRVGTPLTVNPNVTDPDGDPEDTTITGTTYQWYSESSAGVREIIAGQNGKSYTPVAKDTGKRLFVEVTPATSPVLTDPFRGDSISTDVSDPVLNTYEIFNIAVNSSKSWAGSYAPETGYINATFTPIVKFPSLFRPDPHEFNWSIDVSWATVSPEGEVKLINEPKGKQTATLTIQPKDSRFNTLRYSFTIKNWLTTTGNSLVDWSDAEAGCRRFGNNYGLSTINVAKQFYSDWGVLRLTLPSPNDKFWIGPKDFNRTSYIDPWANENRAGYGMDAIGLCARTLN